MLKGLLVKVLLGRHASERDPNNRCSSGAEVPGEKVEGGVHLPRALLSLLLGFTGTTRTVVAGRVEGEPDFSAVSTQLFANIT